MMFTNTDFVTAPFKPSTIKLDKFQAELGNENCCFERKQVLVLIRK